MSADQSEDFGTQVIVPVAFRHPTAWLSWQAVLGDLVARGSSDARLRIEAAGAEDTTHWTAEIEWDAQQIQVSERPSLPTALLDLWREVSAQRPPYPGDLSQRGPAVYEPHECLDAAAQAALQRLLGVIRAAFGADWTVTIGYHPVLKADQRIHSRLVARRGEVAVTAGGATLIEGCRSLMRAAAPYFPKARRGLR